MLKKWISFVLALSIVLTALPVFAGAEYITENDLAICRTETVRFPDPMDPDQAIQVTAAQPGQWQTMSTADGEYLTDPAEAGAVLREGMKNRETTVTIFYQADASLSFAEVADSIRQAALAHTGEPTEGDYLARQRGKMDASGLYYPGGETNDYTITFEIEYYTTAQQEAQVDAAVAELLASLDLEGKTDYEKLCAVYQWMCANITYDDANLEDETYVLKYTAYAALIERTAVCQGYAVLLYRLMLELGIDCRLISGTGNGGGHAWNIVKLGGQYYNVDATWDATYYSVLGTYEYFLRSDDTFGDHVRDAEYLTAEFAAAYPMSAADYDPDAVCTHTYTPTVTAPTCTEKGYTTYTCTKCHYSYISDETEALGHTPGEVVVENEGEHGSHDLVVYCDICGEELSREYDDGYIPGDINGDGEINNKDLTRLFQYLSGYDVEVTADALDVNVDDSVNNKDLTRLFQYLSGWNVEIH